MTPLPPCAYPDCPRPVHAKGYCTPHYRRSRAGTLDKPVRGIRVADPASRFWPKVQKTDGCWLWLGGKSPDGYGMFSVQGRNITAYRFSYELLVGPVPEGLHLDHLCRNTSCVRPDHLEPVTNGENTRRGESAAMTRQRAAARTHCGNGHEWTPENTYIVRGTRTCRACRAVYDKRTYERKKLATN